MANDEGGGGGAAAADWGGDLTRSMRYERANTSSGPTS
jgi:hypothetical protein